MKPLVRSTTFFLLFSVLLSASTLSAEPKYVGLKGCKSCHKNEVADWEKSKHAKAFSLLKAGKKKSAKKKAGLDPDKDYTADKDCVGCHTIGYKEKGGFVDLASTENKTGVGCESCHGPGSDYRKLHIAKKTEFTKQEAIDAGAFYTDTDPDMCSQCHVHEDNPFDEKVDAKYSFDLEERLKKYKSYHQKYPMKGKH